LLNPWLCSITQYSFQLRAKMHVLLIRHGQSKNNILEAAHGCGKTFNSKRSIDPPLSDLGKQQAQLLGVHLGGQLHRSRHKVHLFCSSMTRAVQTLMPLARVLDLKPTVHPSLHEVNGFYDTNGQKVRGPDRAALKALCPEFSVDAIPEEGQGDETGAEAWQRATQVVGMLNDWAMTDRYKDQVIIIVSHNDTIALLARLLMVPSGQTAVSDTPEGLFPESYWPMNNTGISHFILGITPKPESYLAKTWLVYWNRSDHLSEDVRSGVNFINSGTFGAAEWARVGQVGSGLMPLFSECQVIRSGTNRRSLTVCVALAGFVAGVGAAFALSKSR